MRIYPPPDSLPPGACAARAVALQCRSFGALAAIMEAMAERTDLLRVALAQINPDRRRHRRQRPQDRRGDRPRARRGRPARGVPGAGAHRLPARGPAAEDALPATPPAPRSRSWPRQTAGHRRAGGLPGAAPTTSTTPPRCWPTASVRAVYRKMYLPNYGVFDEQRYFQAGRRAGARSSSNGVADRAHDLRGHLGAGPARHDRGARGRAGDREPLRLAYHARQGRSSASGCWSSARATTSPPWSSATWSAARTSWSSTATASRSTRTARSSPGRRSSRRRSRSARIDPGAVAAARLRDARHRAAVRRQRRAGHAAEPPVFDARERQRRARGEPRSARRRWPTRSAPEDGGLRGARAPACATTSRRTASSAWCSALSGGIDSALVGADRRRRARPRARHLRRRCPRPTRREGTQDDARAIAENLGVDFLELAHRAGRCSAYERDAGARPFEGREPGHHRGEPAGAHPRQPGDGAVEQVRLARADHRQQVRDVGRLRHALRRHGRRLRRAQGRLQELGLPARALAQRAGGPRAGAGVGARPPAVGRAAPRAARRRVAAALRRARRDPRGLRRGGPRRRRAGAPRPARPRTSSA